MGGSAEALSALCNRKIRGATLRSRFVGLFVSVLQWRQAACTTCGTESIDQHEQIKKVTHKFLKLFHYTVVVDTSLVTNCNCNIWSATVTSLHE